MQKNYFEKLAIQMYTVHEHAWNNLEQTLCKLKAMGYEGIEYYGHHSLFHLDEVRRMEEITGVKMIGWHTEWADLQEETYEETVSYLEKARCPIVIVPCLGGEWNIAHNKDEECKEVWLSHIKWMNELEKKLKERGIRLAYHNHDHEFLLRYDNKKVFDILFQNLSPEIMLEFDTGRAICAGEDCCSLLEKYSNREALIHLKPYSSTSGYDCFLGDEEDLNDVKRILQSYKKEFKWIIVESENSISDEMANAERNIEYLRKLQIEM